MPKPSGDSPASGTSRPRALFLSPEAPWPPVGGGAMRSSALLHYLRARFEVDVVTFTPDVADSFHIALPAHSRSGAARAWRQVRRLIAGRPPLLDRFAGFERELEAAMAERRYRVAVVEHFWCAPYLNPLRRRAGRVVLDLHNVESALARRVADAEPWPVAWASRRFAAMYEKLERRWLPRFDTVLAASADDAGTVRRNGGNALVYPNTLPSRPLPAREREPAIVFTGNLEYHPNIAAVRWFASSVWPLLRDRLPGWEWRLVGRNPHAVENIVRGVPGVRITGPVADAIDEIARASISVAPLLAGSGTRFKIVEAWCAGTPVVSTPIGAEGLGARHGDDLLLAVTPSDFAEATIALARDPGRQAFLSSNGRARFEREFTHEAGWRLLDESGVFASPGRIHNPLGVSSPHETA